MSASLSNVGLGADPRIVAPANALFSPISCVGRSEGRASAAMNIETAQRKMITVFNKSPDSQRSEVFTSPAITV